MPDAVHKYELQTCKMKVSRQSRRVAFLARNDWEGKCYRQEIDSAHVPSGVQLDRDMYQLDHRSRVPSVVLGQGTTARILVYTQTPKARCFKCSAPRLVLPNT